MKNFQRIYEKPVGFIYNQEFYEEFKDAFQAALDEKDYEIDYSDIAPVYKVQAFVVGVRYQECVMKYRNYRGTAGYSVSTQHIFSTRQEAQKFWENNFLNWYPRINDYTTSAIREFLPGEVSEVIEVESEQLRTVVDQFVKSSCAKLTDGEVVELYKKINSSWFVGPGYYDEGSCLVIDENGPDTYSDGNEDAGVFEVDLYYCPDSNLPSLDRFFWNFEHLERLLIMGVG